ncbi:hypothetical protein V6N11_049791 [Hibiscus sabdariffa]|uniref:Uncharacterized protein n=1 Tax=Hibiscus sabdariffa TaxID=183260 RepID=A0ABR2T8K9_9ROSI
MHFEITSVASMVSSTLPPSPDNLVPLAFDFDFSGRFGSSGSGLTGSMTSADKLFLNRQIRPVKLSTHLERPQVLAPLMDLEHEDDEENGDHVDNNEKDDEDMCNETGASMSASSSWSSSAGRSSKRWVFLKDFLRSKSEGRSNNRLWSTISFSPTRQRAETWRW